MTNAETNTEIAQKHCVAGVLNASAIGKPDIIEKAVLRSLFALTDPDPESAVIPVEEAVQEAGVRASERAAEL
jgi:hypothetical protein